MNKTTKTANYYKDPARPVRVLVATSNLADYMRTLMASDHQTGWAGLNPDDVVEMIAGAACEVAANKRLGPGVLFAVAQELNERANLALNPTPTNE